MPNTHAGRTTLEAVELSRHFVRGLMDAGQELGTVVNTATADLFLLVGGFGFLAIRTLDFLVSDWLTVCSKLPRNTFIDPADWELHSLGFESIFIPAS